jgi:hypothetical protein
MRKILSDSLEHIEERNWNWNVTCRDRYFIFKRESEKENFFSIICLITH